MKKEYWFIALAAIFYGTVTAGAQFFSDLGFSLYEISIYRVLLTGLILLPAIIFNPKYRIKKNMIKFFVVFGLIGAVLQLTQFGGIILGIPVAIAIFLIYSQPIWTVILGKLILKEKITKRKIAAIAIAILGIVFLVNPWDIESVGPIEGIVVALLGGVVYSLWIIWGRKSGIKQIHPVTTAFGWTMFSFIWLILLLPVLTLATQEPDLVGFSFNLQSQYWYYLIGFALISGVIPHLIFNRGLKKTPASTAGIILLFEPVSATILAAIVFTQPIGMNIILGGGLILLSNYVIFSKK